MSEYRNPAEVWIKRLPKNEGKKALGFCTTKIELFPAHYWAEHWEPGSDLFSPKLPLQSEARKAHWESHFRVRVNGKWMGKRAKYVTYTKAQVLEKFFSKAT